MRTYFEKSASQDSHFAEVAPVAGVLSGLIAGTAYLMAQMSMTVSVRGGEGWEPLLRIAAILLGPDAASPPYEFSWTIVGMAVLIHFALAIVYGRCVDLLARGSTPVRATLIGAMTGLVLYFVNFWLIAPVAFPWFEETRDLATLFDHLIFGSIAGLSYAFLRRSLHPG